ncbi:MAG TPA: hypothetical protein VG122_03670, partial [Gemmata sp.]|nr:hypothetical protein [Gemmata sp.]
YAPDEMRIAVGSRDGVVRLWDLKREEWSPTIFQHDKLEPVCLEWSPDGRLLAVGAVTPHEKGEYIVTLWDGAEGKQLKPSLEHKDLVSSLTFSPDGTSILTGCNDGTAQLWDVATRKPTGLPMRHPHGVRTARFTPDGRMIATGGKDGMVRWWDVATGTQLIGTLPRYQGELNALSFSPDGNTLVTSGGLEGAGGTIQIWEVAHCLQRPLEKENRGGLPKVPWVVNDTLSWRRKQIVSYSPDGKWVITGTRSGRVRLNGIDTGMPHALPLRNRWDGVYVTLFSPDGRLVATASEDKAAVGEVRLWDTATGLPACPPLPHLNWVASLAFSPDGKILVTGGYDSAIHFWDSRTGKRIGRPIPQEAIVQSITFSPDGKTIAVGQGPVFLGSHPADSLMLWDVDTHRKIGQTIRGPRTVFNFSPDGRALAAAESVRVRLWNTSTGLEAGPVMTELAEVNALTFSPDGKVIATGSTDGTVRIWDPFSGKPIGTPMLHSQRVNIVAFSPDPEGKLILTACEDGSVRVWDRTTQQRLGPAVIQNQELWEAAFTSDSCAFLTTTADGTTRRWPVPMALDDDADRLTLRLEVRTGLKMGPGQTVRQLSPMEWDQHNKQLEALEASTANAYAGRVGDRAFHNARAREAEEENAAFAAKWHLDQLIANASRYPANLNFGEACLSYARRAHRFATEGHFGRAEEDYSQSLKLGSADLLVCWYRHRIVDCFAAKQWPLALWYLDRAIDIAPGDWQLYADRATVQGELGRLKARATDLAIAMERGGDSDLLIKVGDEYARRGEWKQSAAAYKRAIQLGPCPADSWERQALVYLKVDDRQAYQTLCAGLGEAFRELPHPRTANSAMWVCVLGPKALSDYSSWIEIAERAVEKGPEVEKGRAMKLLAALHYRTGRYKEAIAGLQECMRLSRDQEDFESWVFLAMAHHHVGATMEAQKLLVRLRQLKLPSDQPWKNLELEQLTREVEAVLRNEGNDK